MKLYFGKVENILDPLKQNRVRVRVFHVHSQNEADLPTDKLFWSTVLMPSTGSSTSGIGQNHGLLVGSHVIGSFIDAFQQHFVILGTFYGVGDMPEQALENYPLNKVSVSETGHSLQFNDSTKEVILSNGNGNNLLLNGSVNLKSIANINLDSDADTSVNVKGNLLSGSDGYTTFFSNGQMNIGSSTGIVLSAPRIDLNPNFSFAEPGLTDLQLVKIKTRKAITPLVTSSTGISQKDDLLVEKIEPGNICTLTTPKNLYDEAFSTIDTQWNRDSIKVIFEELGFPQDAYDENIYWGTVFLGAVLKRSGFKYIKTASAFDYGIYENSSEVQKALTKNELQKGDIIIFTRNDSYFVGVSDGTYNDEYQYYTVILGDYEDSVYVTDIFIDEEIKLNRIIRPRACNDNKIFYNGDCTLPKIKTGFMINDDLIAMALNIYWESGGEKQIFPEDGYALSLIHI